MLAAVNRRRDIDGLRAVAVAAVLAFHAFPRWLPGGYAGVDIFFCISGYVITRAYFASVTDGTFRWTEFYRRRIRRIFPALLVVLFGTVIAGWFELWPGDFARLAHELVPAAVFVPNFFFWYDAGYFDADA